jgi:ketosteroid isomerase-like protein
MLAGVSDRNLELIRSFYERWAVGDFKTDDVYADDFTLTLGADFPDAGVHKGRDGLAAYMKGFLEPWASLTIKALEISGGGERVLAKVLQSGTGVASGIPVELDYFQLWSFEGDSPIALESIKHESEARARLDRGLTS